tara:strand:+ start:68 stop:550 length:483 start_codon:yes stop_codon:yes gene_type:complete
MKLKNKNIASILIFFILSLSGCGYKIGGLEVIGENSEKTANIKIISNVVFYQSFINSGFKINNDIYDYVVIIEGPYFDKSTASVTSNATENEFTLTGSVIISLLNKENEIIVNKKLINLSKDHKFSSSNINSSEKEEEMIQDDIIKFLKIQIINTIKTNI